VSLFRRRGIESQAIRTIDEPYDPDAVAPPASPDQVHPGAKDSRREARSGSLGMDPESVPSGPWDVAQVEDDSSPRIDFGSLLVPAVDGMQIRVELNEQEEPVAISVMLEDTALQLQAFAAPRSEGIWDEVRQEIAEGIRGNQGKAREAEGPFGRELRAEVPVEGAAGSPATHSVRFIGVDGPRWFLRGLLSGTGGSDPEKAAAVEQVFRDVAVRRGYQAAPPREPLPLDVPDNSGLLSEQPPSSGG